MAQGRAARDKRNRRLGAIALDILAVSVVYLVAISFRYWGTVIGWTPWTADFLVFWGLAVVVHLVVNSFFGVYATITRSMSLGPTLRTAAGTLVGAVVLGVIVLVSPLWTPDGAYLVPRSVVIGGGLVAALALVAWRFVPRVVDELRFRLRRGRTRVLVVGAGRGAEGLLREIGRSAASDVRVVGIVDDDPRLRGMHLLGYRVLGRVEDVPRLARERAVDEIIVAIPSATAEQMTRIYQLCRPAGKPIKTIPSLRELLSGQVKFAQARELDVKDLLGRPVIRSDLQDVAGQFRGTTVIVTGAAGSIGSELCRQLAQLSPARLVLVDHNESGLYELCDELHQSGFENTHPLPFDLLQEARLRQLFARERPHHVFHAAAYKHVPLMELSPDEAILNNILGTMLVAEAAGANGAANFVNISTDKAVQPVSVMGATKWGTELIVGLMRHRYTGTRFATVRFGNVLGSRGSVVPLFRRQIEMGGPVTVTHPEMTRYFMLIEEAVQLVLQATAMTDAPPSEEVGAGYAPHTFVLDMGTPVPIIEVARRMVEFHFGDGRPPVEIVCTGVRPGERLYERLTWPFEDLLPTSHPLVKNVSWSTDLNSVIGDESRLTAGLQTLIEAARRHEPPEILIQLLSEHIPGFAPQRAAD